MDNKQLLDFLEPVFEPAHCEIDPVLSFLNRQRLEHSLMGETPGHRDAASRLDARIASIAEELDEHADEVPVNPFRAGRGEIQTVSTNPARRRLEAAIAVALLEATSQLSTTVPDRSTTNSTDIKTIQKREARSTRETLQDGRIREIVEFASGVIWEKLYDRDGSLQSGRMLSDAV